MYTRCTQHQQGTRNENLRPLLGGSTNLIALISWKELLLWNRADDGSFTLNSLNSEIREIQTLQRVREHQCHESKALKGQGKQLETKEHAWCEASCINFLSTPSGSGKPSAAMAARTSCSLQGERKARAGSRLHIIIPSSSEARGLV